mmetsp:Transcript_57885/g.109010  ORF Transcript_57885/g.109010 Transcript_57885/m.109010 type:complete len:222 (-) Transcript_57885:1875-2540(-)
MLPVRHGANGRVEAQRHAQANHSGQERKRTPSHVERIRLGCCVVHCHNTDIDGVPGHAQRHSHAIDLAVVVKAMHSALDCTAAWVIYTYVHLGVGMVGLYPNPRSIAAKRNGLAYSVVVLVRQILSKTTRLDANNFHRCIRRRTALHIHRPISHNALVGRYDTDVEDVAANVQRDGLVCHPGLAKVVRLLKAMLQGALGDVDGRVFVGYSNKDGDCQSHVG